MAILEEYENRLIRRGRSEQTRAKVATMFRRFEEWCVDNDIRPDRISAEEMEDYFESLQLAESTKHQHLTNIRAAYSYARRRGAIDHDPTIDVYVKPPRENVPRVIPIDELKAMKALCPDRRAVMHFHLLAYTGMRRFELITLPWKQVDLKNRTINVIGKGNKRRQIPIHPALGEVLAEEQKVARTDWLFPSKFKNGPASITTSDRIVDSYATDTFKPTHHDFRRTVATSLDANGVEESIINEIMGWATRTIFARHYRYVAPERLQKAILSLYADNPL